MNMFDCFESMMYRFVMAFVFVLKFRVPQLYQKFEDEDRELINKMVKWNLKILDMNFISIKNMKWQCGKSYKLFFFK